METKEQRIIGLLQDAVNLQKEVLDHLDAVSDPDEVKKDIERIRETNALALSILNADAIAEDIVKTLAEKQRDFQTATKIQSDDHSDNE
ncbi:MAG: hypothetical protein IJ552_07545 [Prevotella sp.]|nr:hypothetical protein [Prevotella sp.]